MIRSQIGAPPPTPPTPLNENEKCRLGKIWRIRVCETHFRRIPFFRCNFFMVFIIHCSFYADVKVMNCTRNGDTLRSWALDLRKNICKCKMISTPINITSHKFKLYKLFSNEFRSYEKLAPIIVSIQSPSTEYPLVISISADIMNIIIIATANTDGTTTELTPISKV